MEERPSEDRGDTLVEMDLVLIQQVQAIFVRPRPTSCACRHDLDLRHVLCLVHPTSVAPLLCSLPSDLYDREVQLALLDLPHRFRVKEGEQEGLHLEHLHSHITGPSLRHSNHIWDEQPAKRQDGLKSVDCTWTSGPTLPIALLLLWSKPMEGGQAQIGRGRTTSHERENS